MSEFMIEYVTRFKVRFENEVKKLETTALDYPVIHQLQLTRARNVVEAANAIIAMGPNAIRTDRFEFENWRSIMLSNNAIYSKTQREIENGSIKATKVSRPRHQMFKR
uniref:Uncharacterized protein n=2 Tax=Caenorhabditis tropicalis TaxID=1561998 RepID=A0A1I7UF21_9PELO